MQEESKHHFNCRLDRSHFSSWEGDGTTNPGKHFQRYEGQEDD